jgi:hypothetical protein
VLHLVLVVIAPKPEILPLAQLHLGASHARCIIVLFHLSVAYNMSSPVSSSSVPGMATRSAAASKREGR